MARNHYTKQDYYLRLIPFAVFFACIGVLLSRELAGSVYFSSMVAGIMSCLGLIYWMGLNIRNKGAKVEDVRRKQIGIAGISLLAALIVFGIPGLDQLSESIKTAILGYSLGFLPTAGFGVAFIVYRLM